MQFIMCKNIKNIYGIVFFMMFSRQENFFLNPNDVR